MSEPNDRDYRTELERYWYDKTMTGDEREILIKEVCDTLDQTRKELDQANEDIARYLLARMKEEIDNNPWKKIVEELEERYQFDSMRYIIREIKAEYLPSTPKITSEVDAVKVNLEPSEPSKDKVPFCGPNCVLNIHPGCPAEDHGVNGEECPTSSNGRCKYYLVRKEKGIEEMKPDDSVRGDYSKVHDDDEYYKE